MMKSGNTAKFSNLSLFKNLQEFNHHMEMWILECKDQFSKGELVGLKRLVRFSARIPGICNAKIGTILKAIHEEFHNHGVSRSTFKRMVGKAKKLGIFTVHETERKNGSQSSNVYVFNRFVTNEPPKQEKMNQLKETTNLSKTNQKERRETYKLDYTYTNDRVPKPFVELVKCVYPDVQKIEEYWHMTQIAAYRYNNEKEHQSVLEISIQSFKQLVRKLKSSQKIKKPIAYFYGILDKKFTRKYFEELWEMGFDCEESFPSELKFISNF